MVIPPAIMAAVVAACLAGVGWLIAHVITLQQRLNSSVHDDGVDDAKDELIETLERNHEALVNRVEILEGRLGEAEASNAQLRDELEAKTQEFDILKRYAAPDGFKLLETAIKTNIALQQTILERLTTTEGSLVEAIGLLREVLTVVERRSAQ